tara:strand:- start:38254 stop:39249 length:996 start_codon:yes stop_codon:yes gene_type:complete
MGDVVDPAARLQKLIAQQRPRFAAGFRLLVKQIKGAADLDAIAALIEAGRLEEAFTLTLARTPLLGNLYVDSFMAAANDTAAFFNKNVAGLVVDFDQTNPFAMRVARENQLRLVREFGATQRAATREALIDGIRTGANPLEQARNFRNSIGLTERQVKAVNNYRRLLNEGDRAALDRALRDKRFDRTINNAFNSDTPLTKAQVDKMVGRYQERYLKYRSNVIARTESLRSVHQGKAAMYQQAIDEGNLDANNLSQEWETSLRQNVRDSHADMHGQVQPWGQLFISGKGNAAPHPGEFGVAEEDIQCVCAVGTRIPQIAVPQGFSINIVDNL